MAADMEHRVRSLAVKLYDIDAIKIGRFETKPGIWTRMYFDLRVVVSYPDVLITTARLLHDKCLDQSKFDSICGVPYTALPIATAISVTSGIPMLIRRKERKDYGTRNKIEGHFKKGQTCLVIEDVIVSGKSANETVYDLRKEGIIVNEMAVVLNQMPDGADALKLNNINVKSIYTLENLVEILQFNGRISEEDAKIIMSNDKGITINGHFE